MTGQNAMVAGNDGYSVVDNKATGLRTSKGAGGELEQKIVNGQVQQETVRNSAGGVGLSSTISRTANANLQEATSNMQSAAGQITAERLASHQRAVQNASKGSNSVQAQEARAYAKSSEAAQKSALTEAAEQTKSQTDNKSSELANMLSASAAVGASLGIAKVGGEYRLAQTNKDGTSHQISLSQKQGEAFERSLAAKEVSSNTKSLAHGRGHEDSTTVSSGNSYGVSKKASKSYSESVSNVATASRAVDEARKIEASGNTNAETAFVTDYAKSKGYGTMDGGAGMHKAMDELAAMGTSDPQRLQALKNEWVGKMAASLGIGGNIDKVGAALTAAGGKVKGAGAVDAEMERLRLATAAAPSSRGSGVTAAGVERASIPTVAGPDAKGAHERIQGKGTEIDNVGKNMSLLAPVDVVDRVATGVEKWVRGGEFGVVGEAARAEDARDGHQYSGHSGEGRALEKLPVVVVGKAVAGGMGEIGKAGVVVGKAVVGGMGEIGKAGVVVGKAVVGGMGEIGKAAAFPITSGKPITGGAKAAATILGAAPPSGGVKPSDVKPRAKPS